MKVLNSSLISLRGGVRIGYLVLLAVLAVPVTMALCIASYFWLSADADALRDSFLSSANTQCKRRIVLNVGRFTTGLARFGLGFINNIPPEARMAANSVQGGEVAVYRLAEGIQALDRARIIAKADKAMERRGMQRVVGVSVDSELVAVYVPRRTTSPEKVKCLVLVVHEQDAVIAGARGNVAPLMEFASEQMKLEQAFPPLANLGQRRPDAPSAD